MSYKLFFNQLVCMFSVRCRGYRLIEGKIWIESLVPSIVEPDVNLGWIGSYGPFGLREMEGE